jgi:hypothetical protein
MGSKGRFPRGTCILVMTALFTLRMQLKSLTALISCGVPNLHFPMMCLVKCYGHCLVVVSKLPLSGNTLIYGSANAAVDIKST